MPALKIASEGRRPGAVSGKVAIRVEFSEAGDLEDLEILQLQAGGPSAVLLRRHVLLSASSACGSGASSK